MLNRVNHYKWLKKHLWDFLRAVGVDPDVNGGIISAHGDKAGALKAWAEENGIPFPHIVAVYLLTHCRPYGQEVRELETGEWVNPYEWVKENFDRFKEHLPPVDETDKEIYY